jgi:formate-dependent nitrite reductase membrane component NrfD
VLIVTELEVTGRNLHVLPIWGWEISLYLFLGGVTAGIMIVSALIAQHVPPRRQSKWMRWMPLLAPVLLSAGMMALLLDLEGKLHVFRFYTAFRITSPMSWGAWILLLIYPATLLLTLVRLTDREMARFPSVIWALARRARRNTAYIEVINLVLGIALGTYTGILLATLGTRALWNSALLGPLFLVSGLSTGAALIMLFPINSAEHEAVRRLDLMSIAAELALIALLFMHLATGSSGDRAAASLFFRGAYTAPFWALVIIAGLLVPLAFEVFEKRLRLNATAMTSLLLLAGGFALRWIFVEAGQAL